MRVLKFRIVSASEYESGVYTSYGETWITAIFQNGSRTLTLVYRDVFPDPLVEIYKVTDVRCPGKFTVETVREFVSAEWYVV
jgi:hypothetical protein